MMIKKFALLLLITALLLCSCGRAEPEPTETPPPTSTVDPYAGLVNVPDGAGGTIWVRDYDDVPLNTLDESKYYKDGEYIDYDDPARETLRGVDVSTHQGEIDWTAVAGDGVEFAIIRAAYRGYSDGELHVDDYFYANIDGAKNAGLKVAVYMFSQAVTVEEAVEEADYLLNLISGMTLDFPVAFDWEQIDWDTARTDDVDGETMTAMCRAFSERIESGGYEAMIYLNRSFAYYAYDLSDIKDIPIWLSAVGDLPLFYYSHYMWQYSFTGQIDGISTDVDLNLVFE